MRDPRVKYLWEGKTVNGRRITLDATNEQNWLRCALSSVQSELNRLAQFLLQGPGTWPEKWIPVLVVVSALEANLANPLHFGDNLPGLTSYGGKQLLPHPRFTYWDLIQYGTSGPGLTEGFVLACGLSEGTTDELLLLATGLLLLDEAVEGAESGRDAFAAYLMHQASKCAEEATLLGLNRTPRDAVKSAIRAALSRAGRESGRARRKSAKATVADVRARATKLLAQGTSERDVAGVIARTLGVTADYVRRLRRMPN